MGYICYWFLLASEMNDEILSLVIGNSPILSGFDFIDPNNSHLWGEVHVHQIQFMIFKLISSLHERLLEGILALLELSYLSLSLKQSLLSLSPLFDLPLVLLLKAFDVLLLSSGKFLDAG